MVGEIDKASEARRKALRNGEEDPVVVAQRFLNIYRQMHIFSPERKEAFNKMLLELSPDVLGLFSSLPGGAMLQDYVDDLTKQNGINIEKTIPATQEDNKQQEQHGVAQQAEILATALAKAQTQAVPNMVTAAPAKIGMDKDFAEEFAKILGELLERQTTAQKESLEKITTDISKTQLFLAKNLKESKEEQHKDLQMLLKNITDFYQAERTQQRQDLSEICKTIAQSQTALSLSMGNQGQTQMQSATQTVSGGVDPGITKKLIDMFIEGQKQINARLEKVEVSTDTKLMENEKLLKTFEQTQTALFEKIKEKEVSTISAENTNERNDEKLAQLIASSQENLIKTLLSANLQQNNTAQANTNANNIQITAPDNSAQMMLLLDKIASMQTSNQQSLEKALVRAIKEQGELYNQISAKQTKELAKTIAESLRNIQTMYVPMPTQRTEENINSQEEKETICQKDISEEGISEELINQVNVNSEENNFSSETELSQKKKKKKKKKKSQNEKNSIAEEPQIEQTSHQEKKPFPTRDNTEKSQNFHQENNAEIFQTEEAEKEPSFDIKEEISSDSEDFETLLNREDDSVSKKHETENDRVELEENNPQKSVQDSSLDWMFSIKETEKSFEETADEWGFGSQEITDTAEKNKNKESDFDEENQLDELAQEEDFQDNLIEAIGDNSYIGISDSYKQQVEPSKISLENAVKIEKTPIIYDEGIEEEGEDPYQNSILKD